MALMLLRRQKLARDPDGFSLVEVIVAMAILVAAAAAAAPLLYHSLQATAGLGTRQTAVTVASQELNYIRSLTPSTLQTGRALSDIQSLNAAPGLVNLTQDALPASSSDCAGAIPECDATASSPSSTAVVPLTQVQTVKNVTYTIRTFINVCYLGASSCTSSTSNGPAQYRVDVDVSWPKAGGANCASGRPGMCEYVVTTLRNATADPVFSLNAAPTVTSVTSLPTTIHAGQPVVLTITGTNFYYGVALSSQTSGDTFGPVTINALGTVITDTYTPAACAALGTRSIGIINPDGTSTTTSVTVAATTPTITSISPPTGTTITSPVVQTLTLTGTSFCPASGSASPSVAYTIGSNPYPLQSVTVNSLTSATATVAFNSSAMPNGTIALTNPDGGTTNAYPYALKVQ